MTAVAEGPAAPEQVAAGAPTSVEQARELATRWANEQAARLTERVQNHLANKNGQSNGGLADRLGGPTTYDPAPVFTPVFFLLPTTPGPAAGADPWLIEANVTVYVDIPAKPYAAFATKFIDLDNDPGVPFFPPVTAGWRYELPNRYLIYNS
jgi:hypothetical protein